MKHADSHIIAAISTIIVLLLLLLLLFKLSITAPLQEEEEGIVVAFGNADMGGGMPDAPQMDAVTQVEQIPAPAAPSRPSDNDLMVQEDEESLELAKQTEEDAKRKAYEEELIRQRKEAEARAEAERVAKEKALAEQRAKEQKANDLIGGLFGRSGTAEGANAEDANENGSSVKGNPVGEESGVFEYNGIGGQLYGRKPRHLPKPSNNFTQEGVVVVQIWVDAAGNVTNATIHEGTTISDRHTQQLALSAARQAKFTSGERPQVGKIVYKFKLN